MTIPGLPTPVHSGKVRELYDAGDGLLVMVASDRMSAFDVVLPTAIPDKGRVLTALSLWWFDQLSDLVPNHVVSADVDEYPGVFRGRDELRGRSVLVRRLAMVPVECVARAYLSGSGTKQYRVDGAVCGVPLPAGLTEGSELPDTIFTPTTKATPPDHDAPMTYAEVEAAVGPEQAAELRKLTIEILDRGRRVCGPRGIILADTKVEWGVDAAGTLVLADEVLTPDSSRFWPAEEWQPGRAQPSYDKQPLRDWLESSGWDKKAPGPELPPEIVAATRERYVAAYERITGERFA
ncbi:phosphoribosylaminoimidazolesuccinocarboxamide synthase [Actinocatenispora rupis]|uniref:Phosphoribosylaminoimidazole-succinocarboxamide synthase n=1 Tax=Actinocatenispora rupis TaxID=519421 RepID=A0A8J3JFK6_9ACTN|nr:phosphoribosylaminoimidazolesuccinocarboxamide synthase [Actinocatenispora rupis]GID13983.1 phosphoribosylaminoimidazole-succinocarboxamide synthase [Actinocatenispora rupis]